MALQPLDVGQRLATLLVHEDGVELGLAQEARDLAAHHRVVAAHHQHVAQRRPGRRLLRRGWRLRRGGRGRRFRRQRRLPGDTRRRLRRRRGGRGRRPRCCERLALGDRLLESGDRLVEQRDRHGLALLEPAAHQRHGRAVHDEGRGVEMPGGAVALVFRRVRAEHFEQGAVDRLGQRLDARVLAVLDAVGVEGFEVGDAAAQLGHGSAHQHDLGPRRRRRPVRRIAAHDIRDHQRLR